MLLCAVPEIIPSQPTLTDRLTWIVKLIHSGLGQRGKTAPIPGPFALLIYRRVCALRNLILPALLRGPIIRARDHARDPGRDPGPPTPTLARQRPPQAPKPTLTHPDFIDPCRDFQLPTHQGWLLRLVPCPDISLARHELITLLDQPELHGLITPDNRLARALRSFCYLLNIPRPAILRRPARVKPPKPPKSPKPRKPRKTTAKRYRPLVSLNPAHHVPRPVSWGMKPRKSEN